MPFADLRRFSDGRGRRGREQGAHECCDVERLGRVGGPCPAWNVHEAFAQPGRVLRQVARMPDGRTCRWIARTVGSAGAGYGVPGKSFAVGLGCDIRHAARLVYARGLDLADPPIGAGCKVCERPACPQRAFPMIGRAIAVDQNRSAPTPYPVAG